MPEQYTDIVTLQTVTFTYQEDGPLALSDVSLAVAPGEFVAVLGHNGSGKSSLAKLCNALNLPASGVVTVCGMNTRD